MKALVWTAPEQMVWMEAEKPQPAANEVRIKVEAVGICGSEIEGYLGHNSLRVPPLIMGHEFSGLVESLGTAVEEPLEIGQRVVVNPLLHCGKCRSCDRGNPQLCANRQIIGIHRSGAFGQWVTVPSSAVIAVPNGMSPFRAALAEPLACSLRAVRRAMDGYVFPNVVIFGAGGIGLLCAKAAKRLGAESVIVVDTNPQRLEIAREHAADQTINPAERTVEEVIRKQYADRGVDVVVDAAGFQPTRSAAAMLLNPGGTLMNIGLGIDDTILPVNHFIRSEIRMLGSFCYDRADFAAAVNLLAGGAITEDGWTDIRPLSEGGRAFEDLVAGRVHHGKIILDARAEGETRVWKEKPNE
ncbi:galactitol-1-phosphate 5-dehydrogenase [Paenibacillus senegalensis]|uniref:galactitol-1-phosphate 5-dehydrogenase n=1 Tax=Paenibacillus senegalensis TaxID=1465766 RepID=UPI00028976EF|nr:galactitol-1-phosphate 5-dehydrogenase [Paenibacillus senegalensis]